MSGPLPPPDVGFRLFSAQHNGQCLFVSNDMAGADHIVEAHQAPDEERNRFEVNFSPNGELSFFNTSTRTFLFLSNDQRGNDFVIEAHGSNELRNIFTLA